MNPDPLLLQDYVHHTNLKDPRSKSLTYNKYPQQELDVGKKTILKFRYRQVPEYNPMPETHRPADDDEYVEPSQFRPDEEDNIIEGVFRILRHDKMNAENPKMIALSEDYKKVLCIMLNQVEDFATDVFIYPNQIQELAGLFVEPKFEGSTEEPREAYVISGTVSEPMYCVIVEYISEDEYRVITGDEAQFVITDDDLSPIYLSDDEIAKIRKKTLRGRSPYAPNSNANR